MANIKSIASLIVIAFGYWAYLINRAAIGFYSGYHGAVVEPKIKDYVCFAINMGYLDLWSVLKGANGVQVLNFSEDSVQDAWDMIKGLNSLSKKLKPCLENVHQKEADGIDKLKEVGMKILDLVPFGDTLKKGKATIELALKYKELVEAVLKLRNLTSLHVEIEETAKAIGTLVSTLEAFISIEDFKVIESVISLLSSRN